MTVTRDATTTGFFNKTHSQVEVYNQAGTLVYIFDDAGDFKASGFKKNGKAVVDVVHRNAYQGSEEGAPANVTGSFSGTLHAKSATHATDVRVDDVLLAEGSQAAFDSDNPNGGTAHQIRLKWILTKGASVSSKTFNACEATFDYDGSGDLAVWNVSFICKGGVVNA